MSQFFGVTANSFRRIQFLLKTTYPYQIHRWFHFRIGTYDNGGKLTTQHRYNL